MDSRTSGVPTPTFGAGDGRPRGRIAQRQIDAWAAPAPTPASDWVSMPAGHGGGLVALLPLAPGDHVGIWGADVATSEAITAAGALPVMIDARGAPAVSTAEPRGSTGIGGAAVAGHLPLRPASLDHLIVPEVVADVEAWLPGEAARVVKPGGWLVLTVTGGFRGRRVGLLDLHAHGRFPDAACSPPSGRCRCADWEARGFRIAARYGRGYDARGRIVTVPLDRPGAVRYYLDALRGPAPRWGRLFGRFAGMLVNAGRPDRLFETVVAVGQRVAE